VLLPCFNSYLLIYRFSRLFKSLRICQARGFYFLDKTCHSSVKRCTLHMGTSVYSALPKWKKVEKKVNWVPVTFGLLLCAKCLMKRVVFSMQCNFSRRSLCFYALYCKFPRASSKKQVYENSKSCLIKTTVYFMHLLLRAG